MGVPELSDVLRRLQTQQVCTGVQCFESAEDAGFGPESALSDTDWSFHVVIAAAVAYLVVNAPRNLLGTSADTKPIVRADEPRT